MEVITIDSEAYHKIIDSISEIKDRLNTKLKQSPLTDTWLDISDVCMLLKISKRNLQTYRDKKTLSFSQIAGKIYFKACDIEEHLKKHYQPAIKK